MIVWLEIGDNPITAFYSVREPIDIALPSIRYPTLLAVSTLRRPLRVGGGSEAANMSATLKNDNGEMTNIVSQLVFKNAIIKQHSNNQTRDFFTGVVRDITFDSQITLSIVS